MIKGKVKIFWHTGSDYLQNEINQFLETIDIRQVIKTDFSTSDNKVNAIIWYVNFEDIREAKLQNILDTQRDRSFFGPG